MSGITKQLASWLWLQSSSDAAAALSPLAVQVTALYDEFRAPLLRYAISLGLPVPDAEDILQEVFVALFHHLQSQRPNDNLRGWIFRVGHNLALRRRQANSRVAKVADCSWQLIDGHPNPEQQAALSQLQVRLVNIFNALPDRDRCCLNLRAEGLRYREIAEALEISVGAVAASLSRALARFSTAGQGALR